MQKRNKLKSLFFGLLFSFLVPLGAYLFLKFSGHDGRMPLPKFYGIEKIDSPLVDGKIKPDTVYRLVKDLKLVNQLGDSISLNETLKGKILVMNFFKTVNDEENKVITNCVRLLNKAFLKNDSTMRFVSISIDSKNDTVLALRLYADNQKANHDKWLFCNGSDSSIQNYLQNELELQKNDYSKIVLIDKYRNIRGYYNGLDSNNVRLCAEDISYLMVEKNLYHEKNRRR
jgi:protein SCO1/2